jgi:hypothetical protein
MSPPSPGLLAPPHWSSDQLEVDRLRAVEVFRKQRLEEPIEAYAEAFDESQKAFEDLLELTLDLTDLRGHAAELIRDKRLRDALRYVAGPPLSDDDWKILAEATFSSRQLSKDPAMAERLIDTILAAFDRRRFPWVQEHREPDAAVGEKASAVLASAAMAAMRKAETGRRSESKDEQETFVEDILLQHGFDKVPALAVRTLSEAPAPGKFCREAMLGRRKADFIIGVPDGRTMALECKVSNSALNSIKRLNNDAAIKAEIWRADFGDRNVVSAAVLAGVYKLSHLESAQQRGLTLFWSHSLESQLVGWLNQTKAS